MFGEFLSVDERYNDRLGCGDEIEIDRWMRAARFFEDLHQLDFAPAPEDVEDDRHPAGLT